jgi:5-hydroxyisourate hydrolase
MPGLSIHVVDVSRGAIAVGMAVAVFSVVDAIVAGDPMAAGTIAANGSLEHPALARTLPAGFYEAVFEVGAYYRAAAVTLPALPFLDRVTFRFGIDDPAQHYHLPFKCTPWGYSCFRGGS